MLVSISQALIGRREEVTRSNTGEVRSNIVLERRRSS